MGVRTKTVYEEITEYIHDNYPELAALPQWVIGTMVFKHTNKFIVEKNVKQEITGVGFFVRVDDTDFERIKCRDLRVTVFADITYLLEQRGKNLIKISASRIYFTVSE